MKHLNFIKKAAIKSKVDIDFNNSFVETGSIHIVGPKGRWSEGSLARRWSEGLLVRRVVGPKGHWS